MAVTGRDISGGTSFLDLSGELRNIIYKQFIDLRPSARDAANLACTHKQIHSEFGTLFFHRGVIRVGVDDLYKFLYSFFVRYPNSALKDVSCGIRVMTRSKPSGLIDLLPVLSILRHYPLLRVALREWYDKYALEKGYRFPCLCLRLVESFLTRIDAQHLEKLVSVTFSMDELDQGSEWDVIIVAVLLVVLKKGVSKQTVENWELSHYGYSKVVIRREDHLDTEYSELDSDDGLDSDEDSDSREHELEGEEGKCGLKGQEGE